MLQSGPQIYVGLDVSKLSINVALPHRRHRIDQDRIPNTPEAVRSLVRRWADTGSFRTCRRGWPVIIRQ